MISGSRFLHLHFPDSQFLQDLDFVSFPPDFLVLLDFWESVDFARFRPDFGHSQSLCKSLVLRGVFDTFPALFQISLSYLSKEKIPATGGQFRGYRGFSGIFSTLHRLIFSISSRFLGSSDFSIFVSFSSRFLDFLPIS